MYYFKTSGGVTNKNDISDLQTVVYKVWDIISEDKSEVILIYHEDEYENKVLGFIKYSIELEKVMYYEDWFEHYHGFIIDEAIDIFDIIAYGSDKDDADVIIDKSSIILNIPTRKFRYTCEEEK